MTVLGTARQVRRRLAWLRRSISWSALINLVKSGGALALQRERSGMLPPMVKIDISPVCALACPACLHANPAGRNRPLLDSQSFHVRQRMTCEQFTAIIDEIHRHTLAVSLYYYGDPLTHPDFSEMVRIASDAGLSTHASTHLSYRLTDAKIAAIVESGLTHLSITVDGATQETYGVTRVRGRLEWVLENLRRIAEAKQARGLAHPAIEVQYLRHPHHPADEGERVERLARSLGAETFSAYDGIYFDVDGDLYNAVDTDLGASDPGPPKGISLIPHCHWPYTGTVIKYDGDVLPCCKWREAQQYSGGDARALGNVFQTSLRGIWNGASYRRLRRLMRNPAAAAARGETGSSFCEGCPKLFATPARLGEWEAQ